MTKKIRVENADSSDYKVIVQVWEKGANGEPDRMVDEKFLLNPADLAEFTIWENRYLVVKETKK